MDPQKAKEASAITLAIASETEATLCFTTYAPTSEITQISEAATVLRKLLIKQNLMKSVIYHKLLYECNFCDRL